jgi:8-oxo-dGTP diphosphatase
MRARRRESTAHCAVRNGGGRLEDVTDDRAPGFLAPHTVRFCPLCGGPTAREPVPPDHREQHVCSRCRFVFYLNPKVVGATLPEQGDAILLTRRSIDPGRGLWTFPGGFVDFGESVTDAAVRETFEETGLTVDLTGLHNVYTYPGAPVIIVYRARVIGGTLTTCDENDALEWVLPGAIPWDALAFPSTRAALREWVAGRGGAPGGSARARPLRRARRGRRSPGR